MVQGAPSAAPGHGNFPNNRFSPTIFAESLIYFNRIYSVCDEITNTKFDGTIASQGDRVEILKEPEINVFDYQRGQELPIQFLDDDYIQMNIDQAKAFNFLVDDIEKHMSHIDWMTTGKDTGLYKLVNAKDANILQYMHDNATDASDLGSAGSAVTVGFGGGAAITPLDVVNHLATQLDENDTPRDDGRFFLASPAFYEALRKEDSSLINAEVTGDPISALRDAKYGLGNAGIKLHGFNMYMSNNNPTSSSSDVTVMAGHKDAVATATAILNTRVVQSERTFGDLCQGLIVWGRRVLKAEDLFTGYVSIA